MKRAFTSFLTLILTLITSVCLFACAKEGGVKVSKISVDGNASKNYVAIFIGEGGVEKDTTLSTVMEALQEADELSFTISSGMLTQINGVENAANYNPCWMLYTDDEDFSNTQYGAYDYQEKSLGNAIVGAEALSVKEGKVYVWVYQTF